MNDKRKKTNRRGPQDKEKAITAAAMLLAGSTQEEAALAVGVTARSITNWIQSWWWSEVRDEAMKSVIFDQMRVLAINAVMKALKDGDGALGLKILERLHPEEFTPGQSDSRGIVIRVVRDE